MPRNILQLIAPGRARQLGAAESAFIYVLAAVTCSVAIAVGFAGSIGAMLEHQTSKHEGTENGRQRRNARSRTKRR